MKEELDFLEKEREKIESLIKNEEELEELKIKGAPENSSWLGSNKQNRRRNNG